ncbi:TetR/AcrR family transcriptional regulator [Aquimarina algiphila]|uniref:TetR/AcrR family transcriptional regulator n=1 Tax=Aquimarina algiphila TaxID=2047982 RepID=UPI00233025B5|nr:TetR/AcrR family transcriptional regulator [Aquimarina algiphila]
MKKGEYTRHTILEKAFEISYKKGYQSTSVDDIIALTSVSKGSFFYHFKNKDEMGLAMINEIMYPGMYKALVIPLNENKPATQSIYDMIKSILIEDPAFDPRYGCPAVNIIEEMAPLNASFNKALSRLIDEMQNTLEEVLTRGKKAGQICKELNVKESSVFIITSYMGIRNLGKLYGVDCYQVYLKELKRYLSSIE